MDDGDLPFDRTMKISTAEDQADKGTIGERIPLNWRRVRTATATGRTGRGCGRARRRRSRTSCTPWPSADAAAAA